MSLVTGIGAQGNVTVSQDMCDWTARIEFNKYELSTRFGVLLFLGEVPNSPQDWLTSPNLVGTHFTYVDGRSHRGNRRGGVVEGFVHLNQGILKHSGLQSLAIEVVEPYLTRALDWRVQTMDDQPCRLDSLEVTVYVTPLSYPPGSMFPVPGERHRLDGITYGRDGGSRRHPA